MSCLAFPLSDEEPAYKSMTTSPWHPPCGSQGALELASIYLYIPGLTGEEGLSTALSAGVEGLPYPHPGSSIWLCTLPGVLVSDDLRLRTLLIPNVPTFPGPELRMLATAAWIVLTSWDRQGWWVFTGCYCCGWVFLSPSFRLITIISSPSGEKKVHHSTSSSARWRFSDHFCSDRCTFYRQETVGMICRALGLQRLSNMANVHAYTGTEYCLFHLSVSNE